jgi:hypothetical protein
MITHRLNRYVEDCVLSCPAYWTAKQRLALLEATKLAGLNPVRLLNETTAIALNYGMLRPLGEKELIFFGFAPSLCVLTRLNDPAGFRLVSWTLETHRRICV